MEASDIYKCIADDQRLRILNLLEGGPLCVCHIQEILEAPQVKISKQLSTMKALDLIYSAREGTWMVYHLTTPMPPLLRTNLDHLRQADCAECNQLQRDLKARRALVARLRQQPDACPEPVSESITCCAP
ncbi:ArsR/SmtB family transcription factor [Coraliomargarita akajimensis]|uniref:Transcriptional regulator, ArsR family n=1 Tax=Coraliomargarita akajimensis (strain DSM 45221 / IAM 15411 / JCM 23193 / KCTC 12865 / 04OKA010-24) TaxID=583355 RepID=D5EK32_CORAD|nr:metalloregulator ArsR/SmtB family transcription factor [Coraliomargarita akajimensis]ADE54781.1 transcriptional regulator, ArsR family [Coraliomargarita akajimensis DSM 45221]